MHQQPNNHEDCKYNTVIYSHVFKKLFIILRKQIVILAALFAVALARPQGDAQILRLEQDNIGIGPYKYA